MALVLIGAEVPLYFLAPLALVQLLSGVWLTLRGFASECGERRSDYPLSPNP